MSRGEAVARARREFGSALRVKEETRAAWQFRWLEETLADLSYAARALRRSPGFAAAGIFSLALGIGANTTIFSLTMEFLFSEPSCRNPETLVAMRVGGNSHSRMPHYRFLRDARVFDGLAGSNEEAESNWRSGDETYRLHAMRVTDNFFGVVGAPVAMGRPIEPGDRDVVVLSDRFWRTRLDADPDVIGKGLTIDGRSYTVSGVLPGDHRTVLGFGFSPDVYLPASRENDIVALIGRLPVGTSLQAAYDTADRRVQGARQGLPSRMEPEGFLGHQPGRRPRGRHGAPPAPEHGAVRGVLRDADDRGRPRPADRVRERLEPAAGPSIGPAAGAGDSARPRRWARSDRAPTADREHPPGPPGHRRRAPPQLLAGRHSQPSPVAAAATRAPADTSRTGACSCIPW